MSGSRPPSQGLTLMRCVPPVGSGQCSKVAPGPLIMAWAGPGGSNCRRSGGITATSASVNSSAKSCSS